MFVFLPESCPRDRGWMRCVWATGWDPAGCERRWNRVYIPWWVQYASSLWAAEPHSMGRNQVEAWTWSLRDDRRVKTELWKKGTEPVFGRPVTGERGVWFVFTWLRQRSWSRGRRGCPRWSFQTCPELGARWCGRRCWARLNPDSSWPHHLQPGCVR